VDVPALKTETSKAELVWLEDMQSAGVLHLTVYPYRLHLPLEQLHMPSGYDFRSSAVLCSIKRSAVLHPSPASPWSSGVRLCCDSQG